MTDPLETLDDALDVWDMWALEPEEHAAIGRARSAIADLRRTTRTTSDAIAATIIALTAEEPQP